MRFPSLFRTYSAFSTHLSSSTRPPAHNDNNNNTTPSSLADLEKNDPSNPHPPPEQHHPSRPPPTHSPFDPTLHPPRLLRFQNLVGISVPHPIRGGLPSRFGGPNLGLYARVCDKEAKTKFAYQLSAFLVNTCYLLQIIVGAALTALGAASGPAAAVTVLGALNTILAGLLTYLKGQGLPGRLEQEFHLLRTLRERVEEVERRFAEEDYLRGGEGGLGEGGGGGKTVEEEVEEIVWMYKEVRQTAEDNAPGTVLPPRGAIGGLMAQVQGRGEYVRGGGGGLGGLLEMGKRRVVEGLEGREEGARRVREEGKGEEGKGVEGVVRGLKDLRERYEVEREIVEEKGDEVVRAAEGTKRKVLEEIEEGRTVARGELERLEGGMKNL